MQSLRGLELDPRHVEVIFRRYETVTKQPVSLESTGETYDDLAARRQLADPAQNYAVDG
jgi:hypothetical protein